MTPLRQRMLEDMQLRGLSARTQECDHAAVRQLADYFHTRPDRLTEEQLRQSLLVLGEREEGRAGDRHDRVVWDPVLLRANAAAVLDDASLCPSGAREEVARGAEP